MPTLNLNKDWKQYRPVIYGDHFDGYQQYSFSGGILRPAPKTDVARKSMLVEPALRVHAKRASVLDLGCANGYFSVLAKGCGAKKVVGIDIDSDYVRKLREFVRIKGIDIKVKEKNVVKVKEKADVVFALALIHWIYSCSAIMGSLKETIKFLGERTRNVLFIEWIDPQDQAIQEFRHIYYNMSQTTGDYKKEKFEEYLRANFNTVQHLGNSKEYREIWMARK